jgi:hypothetical protein
VEIISRKFNEIEVDFFLENSLYINATKIGREFGKKPVDWLKTKETKDYLEAFSKLKNTFVDELVIIKKGGNQKKEQGTWIHKKLIIAFARWLDPHFAVWCDEVIEEILITGSYSLQKEEKSKYAELISETKEVLQLIGLMKDLTPKELFYLQKIMGEKSPTKLLGNSFQNSYFLPTEIGKITGQTGAEINLILEKKGFQFRDENGVWKPTENGKMLCLEIGNQFNQLKWKLETIL